VAFALGCAVAAGAAYVLLHRDAERAEEQVLELQREMTTKTESLQGHARYVDCPTAGRKKLGEQSQFPAAKVARVKCVTRKLERSWFGLRSRGAVSVDYTAECAFGYDLRLGGYALVDAPGGIEVRLQQPALVATPAVSRLRHEVLSGGVLTDEDAAVRELYEEAAERAGEAGSRDGIRPGDRGTVREAAGCVSARLPVEAARGGARARDRRDLPGGSGLRLRE
jgi:hypothetical protein